MITQAWLLNAARSMIGQWVTGEVDLSKADLLQCLTEETLVTLSIYVPRTAIVEVDTQLHQLENGVYFLQTPEKIIKVAKMFMNAGYYGDYANDPYAQTNIIDRQLAANMASAVMIEPTFEWKPPNLIEIFPKNLINRKFSVEIFCAHPPHLQTIPLGVREVLRDLFLSDLARDLLGIRGYFQSISSNIAEINLNMERLTTWADKRDTIIEKLESKQHKNSNAQRIWIA